MLNHFFHVLVRKQPVVRRVCREVHTHSKVLLNLRRFHNAQSSLMQTFFVGVAIIPIVAIAVVGCHCGSKKESDV
jgi:hypothetical protein